MRVVINRDNHVFDDQINGSTIDIDLTKILINQLNDYIGAYPGGAIKFSIKETDHGIGWSDSTLTLDLSPTGWIMAALGVYFAIAEGHKKLRESKEEWKRIGEELRRLFTYLKEKFFVRSFSIEIAFYEALLYLDSIGEIENVSLIQSISFPGAREFRISAPHEEDNDAFESALVNYYQFIFQRSDWFIILLYNDRLDLVNQIKVPFDPRYVTIETSSKEYNKLLLPSR